MKILILNAGSSSLKFELIAMPDESVLIRGKIDQIGNSNCKLIINGNEKKKKVKNHREATNIVLSMFKKEKISAIGHRVVHGGEYFKESTLINGNVLNKIKDLSKLAPVHNPLAYECIKESIKILKKVPQIAVFDTSFHQTIPEENFLYAVPFEYYKKHKIRKYGFHGISHEYIALETLKILGKKEVNIVSCHIGNGSSICAIKNNSSFDTSMGFTPLQGLIMGKRSGDIDAAIVPYLSEKEKISSEKVIEIFNNKSGFFGICGEDDFRIIHEKAERGDKKCKLVIEMLTNQIVKYIGAYSALLGNVDAIVFTAGIGEGADYLRKKICDKLQIELDEERNRVGNGIISRNSETKVIVIPTHEELMIAKETLKLVR